MAAQPVEWVLVVYYGPSAHRATYGRISEHKNKYTKDYIQLSRKKDFLNTVTSLFPVENTGDSSVPITYKWPAGAAPGHLVFRSADRPHLKWETNLGAPAAWKMSTNPSDDSAETLPGDPSHQGFEAAENELDLLAERGAGQPYLLAVKLRDEQRSLHLRVYLAEPSEDFEWANICAVPAEVQALANKTSQQSALEWSAFNSGGVPPTAAIRGILPEIFESKNPLGSIMKLDETTKSALASYLSGPGYGLFFDPEKNHDAWSSPAALPGEFAESVGSILEIVQAHLPKPVISDLAAENLEASDEEMASFQNQFDQNNYEVKDSKTTVKTRGSAQRVFSAAVKKNYGFKCAITGIATSDFLVAAHIVPWSEDQTIRLDPSNGICLSLLVDRAFENGHILVDDDLTISIDWDRVGNDEELRKQLKPFDGLKLTPPAESPPNPLYLQRRRNLVAPC